MIFCPKTTKFSPKLAFLSIASSFGALLAGWLVVLARAVSRKTPIYFLLFFFLSKPHRAHNFDQGGLAVEHVLFRVDPESGQFGQDVDHLEGLQVVDEDVGQP